MSAFIRTTSAYILLIATASVMAEDSLKATGIWRQEGRALALFEEYRGASLTPDHTIHIPAGERFSTSAGKQSTLIKKIDPERGTINAQIEESNQVFQFNSRIAPENLGVLFENASVDQLVSVYSGLAKKNVLIHPDTPAHQFTFDFTYSAPATAAKLLLDKLKDGKVVIVPLSDSFDVVLPERLANSKFDRAKFLKPQDPAKRFDGFIEISSAPLLQVFQLCAELLGAEPAPDRTIPFTASLHHEFKAITPSSLGEVTDALQLLFLWEKIQLVSAGNGKIKAVTVNEK